jgi:hypothetical protein
MAVLKWSTTPEKSVSRSSDVLPSSTEHHHDYAVPPGPGRSHLSETVDYSVEFGAPWPTLSVEFTFSLGWRPSVPPDVACVLFVAGSFAP